MALPGQNGRLCFEMGRLFKSQSNCPQIGPHFKQTTAADEHKKIDVCMSLNKCDEKATLLRYASTSQLQIESVALLRHRRQNLTSAGV